MKVLITISLIVQLYLMVQFLMPLVLLALRLFKKRTKKTYMAGVQADYAIIVTAYQQTEQLPAVVNSILRLNYDNYLIYIVGDNCDTDGLVFASEKVVVLRPSEVLANNVKSHFYAIERFKRPHERLTIIDSDNLMHDEYLNELNIRFDQGYEAVQGVRKAKNLNTQYACLDEAGDTYYRLIDRKLLFEAGSSAALSGSGMAFTTKLYKQCLAEKEIIGAGFDKVLQYEILLKGQVIAFAEDAVVFDEKTSKTGQLVKQRSRWINTWFKYAYLGLRMFIASLLCLNLNRFLFSLMLLRPPLFMLVGASAVCLVINLFVNLWFAIAWGAVLLVFVAFFLYSLRYFKSHRRIYQSLASIPKFIFFQILALVKANKANELSVATEHYVDNTQTEEV